MRFLFAAAFCAMAAWPAMAALQVSDGNPVSGASMGGVNGAVEVTVTAPKAIIDWATLDTAQGELLKFLGEGGYAVLNRVGGGKRTDFMGNLEAFGGHIIIVNPHGIVFGPESLVQAAQFTASSLMIDQDDFMNGTFKFTGNGGSFGEVVNEGTIIARDQAALIAQRVINKGKIVCEEGAILMATGDKVVLGNSGSNIVVEITDITPFGGIADAGHVINRGTLEAQSGNIILAAGDAFAQSLSIAGVGCVENYGKIEAAGDLEAAAADETIFRGGSEINVAGDIRLKGGSSVTVEEDLASGGDMTITSAGMVKIRKADLVSGGDMHITSGPGGSIGVDGGITSGGDMVLKAGTYISVKDDLVSGGDMALDTGSDKTFSTGNLLAEGDINLLTYLELSGGKWAPDGVGSMIFEGQRVEARTGRLTAHGPIWKMTPGELYLYGGGEGLAVDLRNSVGCSGNLYITGEGDIQITGYLMAVYPSWWMPTPGAGEESYIMPNNIGGVSVISRNGKIYSGATDRLNAWIFGYSNDLGGWWDGEDNYIPGDAGVDLPYRDGEGNALGKAAIVLQSKETLKIGEGAVFNATGYYLPEGDYVEGLAGVDDRAGVDFLGTYEQIGGYYRDQGAACDVAIYAGSTAGDVLVESYGFVLVEGTPDFIFDPQKGPGEPFLGPGTVVLDAHDTVSFGGRMSGYLAYKHHLYTNPESPYDGEVFDDYIGSFRMEVASRRTEWLSEAIAWETLPYADEPEFMEWVLGEDYVLRGAGGSNYPPGNRAWVLEDVSATEAAPLYHMEFPELRGCPAELAGAANELGISADRLQMHIGNSLAMNTNIQACDACARLIRAATVLRDFDGGHMAAMNAVFNQLAPADAPLTPETVASIVVAFAELSQQDGDYALASAYVDAYVQYVAAVGELGSPVGDAAAYVMNRHGKALMENANANIAAYVAAQLEQIGG